MTHQTTITPDPDGNGFILHLPEITHLDTQVWSADVGLTTEGLAALRTALAAVSAAVAPPTLAVAEAALAAVETALGDTLLPDAREEALAGIVAVLPKPTDRAAVLREAADAVAAHPGPIPYRPQLDEDGGFWWDTRDRDAVVALLHRMADETATETPERHRPVALATPCTACGHPYNWHTRLQGGCEFASVGLSRCGCTGFVPGERPEPVDPWHILGIEADDEPAAGARQDGADETATETPHTCDNCDGVDPDTCFNNPSRPPEQCPAAEFEDYGQQCQKPAGHNLHSFEEQPAAGARQDGTES